MVNGQDGDVEDNANSGKGRHGGEGEGLKGEEYVNVDKYKGRQDEEESDQGENDGEKHKATKPEDKENKPKPEEKNDN